MRGLARNRSSITKFPQGRIVRKLQEENARVRNILAVIQRRRQIW